MRKRLISSIIALPILIIPLEIGGNLLIAVLFAASVIGLFEFYRAYKINHVEMKAIGYGAACGYYVLLMFNQLSYVHILFGAFLVLLLIVFVIAYPKYELNEVMTIFFGFFYVVYLLASIIQIRNEATIGAYMIWLVFIIAFGNDTFAYLFGKRSGKRKLAPALSPAKTLEGSIGGIMGAITLSLIYGFILLNYSIIHSSSVLPLFAIFGGIGSILAQLGDLAASAIKRQTNIKDFGKIMPGHGGILDRLDSIIFTAPFVYYVMKLYLIS